jgi:uncharacterized BrkB/YihY/UPF0761 family membrane protein
LLPLGLGGFSSILAASLGRYRIVFTVLALLMLAAAHYLFSRRVHAKKIDRLVLWAVSAVVIAILLFY